MTREIRDGIYAYVSGTVTRTFVTKNGPCCEVEVMPPNAKYGDKVTVWGLGDQVTEGDRITAKGFYSDKRETYTDQQGVEKIAFKRSLNKPELAAHDASGAGARNGSPQGGNSAHGAAGDLGGGFGDDSAPF